MTPVVGCGHHRVEPSCASAPKPILTVPEWAANSKFISLDAIMHRRETETEARYLFVNVVFKTHQERETGKTATPSVAFIHALGETDRTPVVE